MFAAATLALTSAVVNDVALFSKVWSVPALPCVILTFQLAAVIAGALNTKPAPVPVAAVWKVTRNLNTYLRQDTKLKYSPVISVGVVFELLITCTVCFAVKTRPL